MRFHPAITKLFINNKVIEHRDCNSNTNQGNLHVVRGFSRFRLFERKTGTKRFERKNFSFGNGNEDRRGLEVEIEDRRLVICAITVIGIFRTMLFPSKRWMIVLLIFRKNNFAL